MFSELLLHVGVSVGALLPIVNPISTAPTFLSVTAGSSTSHRRQQARLAAIYMCCILGVSYFAGELVLTFFGISLAVLRIAGGIIIVRIALGMLETEPTPRVSEEELEEAQDTADVAFTPVAMPMLAGPGSIAVTIALATRSSGIPADVGVIIGVVIVGLLAWSALRFSAAIADRLGSAGMNVMTRFMGLILTCIGITFIATGIIQGLNTELGLAIGPDQVDAVQAE